MNCINLNCGGCFMKKQMQGIGLMLFGIIMMLFPMINPWIPIFDDLSSFALWIGVLCGIVGLVFIFSKED